VAISRKDIKLLWGRAAGFCSNAECRGKVTEVNEAGASYLTGEMAHIIAKNIGGPRSNEHEGADTYENLILLCPTCHTKIDKAPEGTFSTERLIEWKRQHEEWVDSWAEAEKFSNLADLMNCISGLLDENAYIFYEYGPKSKAAKENPDSTLHAIWMARRLDTIVPNNTKILKVLEYNAELLPVEIKNEARLFNDHAIAYEMTLYERIEGYPQFPKEFGHIVKQWSEK